MLLKVITLGLIFALANAKKLPEFVKTCKWDPSTLNECFKDSFNDIVPRLANGIPEIKLRAIDPMLIEKLYINYGNGTSLNLDAELTNIKVYGPINGKATEILVDTEKKNIEFHITLPDLYLQADYKGTGKVLLIQLNSNGLMTANLTDTNVVLKIDVEIIEKAGKDFLKTNITDLKVDIKTFNFNLDNLFKDKAITDNTNKVINENIHELYDELRPVIIDAIKAVITDPINNVLEGFPFDVLFPK